jgi:glycosyltransferase involved in cell wall biosynthesis
MAKQDMTADHQATKVATLPKTGGSVRHLLVPRPYPRTISLVIAMYNEEETVPLLRAALEPFLRGLRAEAEVVLVNDGSSDSTIDQIVDWAAQDSRVKIVHLSRNFGHQIAATAGLDYASGDAVVLIDADLQDPLDTVHAMIERYCEGYDVAYGRRLERKGETRFKLATAWIFYRLMKALVYPDLPADTGDFRLISRRCLDSLCRMRETHRFLRGMTAWLGYPQVAVDYRRLPRAAGTTKYPLRKMLSFAWTAATSFSVVPLRITLGIGMIAMLCSLEEAVRSVLAQIFGWYTVRGWSSLMMMLGLIGGAILISVGVLGEYIGKLYEQVKERPIYLVTETYNFDAAVDATVSGSASHAGISRRRGTGDQ